MMCNRVAKVQILIFRVLFNSFLTEMTPWKTTCCRLYVYERNTSRESNSNAKQSFYRSFNAVYGKVGRCASEDVIVELLKTKCLPSLLYGIEACPINKSVIKSFE